MALSRIATVLGGLLLSRGGRRLAGRHAGKLALATLAWELYQQHRGRTAGGPDVAPPPPGGTARSKAGSAGSASPKPRPQARTRWSGRKV